MQRTVLGLIVGLAMLVVGAAAAAQDDDLDCVDFTTQEEAQAELDADDTDPNNLDPNGDGIACALLPAADDAGGDDAGGGEDEALDAPVPTADEAAQDAATATPENRRGNNQRQQNQNRNRNNDNQADDPTPTPEPDRQPRRNRDNDNNNQADDPTPTPEPDRQPRRNRDRNAGETPTPTPDAVEDFDCIDFTTQEEAQEVLDQDATDPYNLDPSGDGFACSELPSSDGTVRVVSIPKTGNADAPGHLAGGAVAPLAAASALLAALGGFLALRRVSRSRR